MAEELELNYEAMDRAASSVPPEDLLPDSVYWLLSDAEHELGTARNHLLAVYRVKDQAIVRIDKMRDKLRKATSKELNMRKKQGVRYPK